MVDSNDTSWTVHYTTKNESFLKLYRDLRRVGVKNNMFFLKLYDKKLMDVDPLDEKNLSAEDKARIWLEVKRNPWYFLREVCQVPVAGGGKLFGLHRGNLALVWAKLNNFNFIGLLPRQNFKTMTLIAVDVYIYHYGTTNTEFIYSNKSAGDTKENIRRFKKVSELIPSYLQITNEKKDINNESYIRSANTGNSIKASQSPANKEAADKAGRGLTSPILFFDEFAFLKYNDIIYGSAYPVFSQASEEAIRNDKPHGISIITTPNNLNLENAAFCHMMLRKACTFTEDFYDMEEEEIKTYVSKNSTNGYMHIEFHWHQIGRSEEWYQKQVEGLNGNLMLVKREIDLQWPKSDEESIFSEEVISRIEKIIEEDDVENFGSLKINNYYNLELTRELPDNRHSFMFVVDPGAGVGRDDTAVTILDPITGIMYGKFMNPTISIPDLAEFLESAINKFFPNSFVVIERNSIGIPLLQLLLRSSISNKLYYSERDENHKAERTIDRKTVGRSKSSGNIKRIYGHNTDANNRKVMTESILFDLTNNMPEYVADKDVLDQIQGLIRQPSGKIEHSDTSNDDLLMSLLIGHYIIRHKDLSKFITNVTIGEKDLIDMSKKRDTIIAANKINNTINNNNLKDNTLDRYIEYGDKMSNTDRDMEVDSNKAHSLSMMKNIINLN